MLCSKFFNRFVWVTLRIVKPLCLYKLVISSKLSCTVFEIKQDSIVIFSELLYCHFLWTESFYDTSSIVFILGTKVYKWQIKLIFALVLDLSFSWRRILLIGTNLTKKYKKNHLRQISVTSKEIQKPCWGLVRSPLRIPWALPFCARVQMTDEDTLICWFCLYFRYAHILFCMRET